jgi:hypothetical protein
VQPAQAAVVTREIPYQDADGNRLVGYYAYDDASTASARASWWCMNGGAERLCQAPRP